MTTTDKPFADGGFVQPGQPLIAPASPDCIFPVRPRPERSASDEIAQGLTLVASGISRSIRDFADALVAGLTHMSGRYTDNEYAAVLQAEHQQALARQPKGPNA